jgi:aryl-alcohol dehydrogenase-like predicted oxidoreductase
MEPIEQQPVDQLVSRMPAGAKKDLLEWARGQDIATYVGSVTAHGVLTQSILDPRLGFEITDDDPVNEYFLLRRMGLF